MKLVLDVDMAAMKFSATSFLGLANDINVTKENNKTNVFIPDLTSGFKQLKMPNPILYSCVIQRS